MKRFIFIIFINFNLYPNLNLEDDIDNLYIKRQIKELDDLSKFSLLEILKDITNYQNNSKWKDEVAYARVSSDLCDQEKNYLKLRDNITKKNLENLLSLKLKDDKKLRISLSLSGGGYRALVFSLGCLMGLRFSGLLDSITYITGLSGSSWAIASFYGNDFTVPNFCNFIKKQISRSIYYNFDAKLLLENALHKLFWNQKMNLVGIWGVLLANTFFANFKRLYKTQIPKLSDFQEKIKDGNLPMPILSTIMVNRGYDWLEFSPYEVGLTSLNTYIPTWALSRNFKKGVSKDFCPEIGLDYLMGIWGSAFTASIREILELYEQYIPSFLSQAFDTIAIDDTRISPANLPNFAYLMKGHPVRDYKEMTLVDGGLNCNLAVTPILKKSRETDILIIIDSSTNADKAGELKKAELYASTYGITLPKIDYSKLNIINIYKDFNADIPVIIYMPLIKNRFYSQNFDPESCITDDYCSTFNLKYNYEQFDELSGLGQYNLITSLKEIIDTIREVAEVKELIEKD